MHKQRLFIAVAAALGVVSAFLPWATVSFFGMSATVSGTQGGDGWISLALFATAAGMTIGMGDRAQQLEAKAKKSVAGIGAACIAFMAYELVSIMGAGIGASAGIGVWLSLVAGLAVVALPFAIKGDGGFEMPTKDTIKADLNSDNPDAE